MQKNNWKKCKLGDVCDLIGGFAFKSKSFGAFANKVIKIANIQPPYVDDKLEGVDLSNYNVEKLKKYLINYNDFCLAMTGATIGKLGRYKSKLSAYLNQRVLTFRPSTDVDKDFLYHYLSLDFFQRFINNHIDSETAQPNISATSIGQFELLLPPLEEQKRIAEILGSLDDKIELLQKQNKTLEDMAKALFKSWFVDFDVVKAKQRGDNKADVMREYHLTEELYALFPSSFEDSSLGPIPTGWKVKPLSKIATFLNGLALQKYPARAEEDFLPVIKIAELRNGISTSTDKANTNLPTEYIVHNGDILFSWSGSLMVKVWSGEKGALNQHLFKVFSNGYPKWFYYLWVNHYLPMFQEIAADKATTMGHIQRKHLDQAKVVCPSAAFLDKMDKIFGVILSKIILNNKQIQTLTELRDSLLPRLISGKIEV